SQCQLTTGLVPVCDSTAHFDQRNGCQLGILNLKNPFAVSLKNDLAPDGFIAITQIKDLLVSFTTEKTILCIDDLCLQRSLAMKPCMEQNEQRKFSFRQIIGRFDRESGMEQHLHGLLNKSDQEFFLCLHIIVQG